MLNNKKIKVLDANILYFIGALLFWTIGAYAQYRSLEIGLIVTQYIIILLPPIIYTIMKQSNIKETFRLNKISFKHGFLVACITLLIYPLAVFGNALLMTVISLLGNLNVPQLPTATNTSEYLIFMFIISISAGICEEIFFRGFILSGYERMGRRTAIIFSAILFGIFHFNIYNLMATTILGIVFAYLVVETNSIFAGIIGHIVNNGFAVTLGFVLNLIVDLLPHVDEVNEATEAAIEIPTTVAMLYSTITFGIIAIVTSLIAYKLIKIIKKDCEQLDNEIYDEEIDVKGLEFIPLIFPVILFIITVIIQLREIISLG